MIEFDIIVDDHFLNVIDKTTVEPADNKKILSLINDFEDGDWMYSNFQDFIWDNIAETALSYKDRKALINKPQSVLKESAKKLRLTDLEKNQDGQGSELAEIVLYGIMKHHYNALPVVPKIFYKQNVQDNAKGADSVHVVLEDGDNFSIWFGEAKFYNSIEDERLYSIVDSVENSLRTDKLEKENTIITSVSDFAYYFAEDGTDLYNNISELLAPNNSIDHLKPKLHIPILLLHECEITGEQDCISQEYIDLIAQYHLDRAESYFKKQANRLKKSIFKYSEIHFHLILFPVPKKEPIIKKFVENVEHYKKQ